MIIPRPPKHTLDVPGFNNQIHLENLEKFTKIIPENSKVLEIGCAFGCSTWALMNALPKGCKLHVCDTFGMDNPMLKQQHYNGIMAKHSHNPAVVYALSLYMEKNHREVFEYCVSQHPRYFELHKKTHAKKSLEVLENDNKWDMVYIDGHHAYSTVKKELSYLNGTKYLCGDDYHPAHEGTMKAIDEFLADNEYNFEHDDFETGSGFWKMELKNG